MQRRVKANYIQLPVRKCLFESVQPPAVVLFYFSGVGDQTPLGYCSLCRAEPAGVTGVVWEDGNRAERYEDGDSAFDYEDPAPGLKTVGSV